MGPTRITHISNIESRIFLLGYYVGTFKVITEVIHKSINYRNKIHLY